MKIRGLSLPTVLQLLRNRSAPNLSSPQHVFICVADHFEPMFASSSQRLHHERVQRWSDLYPNLASQFEDSRGQSCKHSFFYAAEQYQPQLVESVAEICRAGFGDIEVQVHHDNDSAENFRDTLLTFTDTLYHKHGMLRKCSDDTIGYGFVHGNWALDNSHPEGHWCGVNNEISILNETGCYADFTLPAAPDPCQTKTINSIYYAVDDAAKSKSHDSGVAAKRGQRPPKNALLMIQGPLMLDWQNKKWGLLPALENGDLQGIRAANWHRFKLWHQASISVEGQPEWQFIKIHTHGCDEANQEILLGTPMRDFYRSLQKHAQKFPEFKYYFVTAFEMAMLVHQAEQGYCEPVFPVRDNQWQVEAHNFASIDPGDEGKLGNNSR